jgi:hypothetical protein
MRRHVRAAGTSRISPSDGEAARAKRKRGRREVGIATYRLSIAAIVARVRKFGGMVAAVSASRFITSVVGCAALVSGTGATSPDRQHSSFETAANRHIAAKRVIREETAPLRPPTTWRSAEEELHLAVARRPSCHISFPIRGKGCPIRGTAFPKYGTRCPIRGQQVLILFYLVLKLIILTACLPFRLTLISPNLTSSSTALALVLLGILVVSIDNTISPPTCSRLNASIKIVRAS